MKELWRQLKWWLQPRYYCIWLRLPEQAEAWFWRLSKAEAWCEQHEDACYVDRWSPAMRQKQSEHNENP